MDPIEYRCPTPTECELFRNNAIKISENIRAGSRFCHKYKVYHSENYRYTKKSCSYLISYAADNNSEQFAKILYFIENDDNHYALIKKLTTMRTTFISGDYAENGWFSCLASHVSHIH
jgi:hypothetical protein